MAISRNILDQQNQNLDLQNTSKYLLFECFIEQKIISGDDSDESSQLMAELWKNKLKLNYVIRDEVLIALQNALVTTNTNDIERLAKIAFTILYFSKQKPDLLKAMASIDVVQQYAKIISVLQPPVDLPSLSSESKQVSSNNSTISSSEVVTQVNKSNSIATEEKNIIYQRVAIDSMFEIASIQFACTSSGSEMDLITFFTDNIIQDGRSSISQPCRLRSLQQLLLSKVLQRNLISSASVRSQLAKSFNSNNSEVIYPACVCLWILSNTPSIFEPSGVLFRHRKIIKEWVEKCSHRLICEKQLRINCKIIQNLVNIEWIMMVLLKVNLHDRVALFRFENFKDPDLGPLLEETTELLSIIEADLLTFKQYIEELKSRKLVPGLMHTERYWQSNYMNFEQHEFEALELLSEILRTESDPQTLSLGLFDLGEFSRLYPQSRRVNAKFNFKQIVLNLLNSQDKQVKREALRTMQKMIMRQQTIT